MLVRRLVALMAVLFLLTALAVAVAPPEPTDRPDRTLPREPAAASRPPGEGQVVTADFPGPDPGSTLVVRAAVGDLIRLTVAADEPDTVEIGGWDRVEPVDSTSPVRTELYADRPGSFAIRLIRAARDVGRIEVSERQ